MTAQNICTHTTWIQSHRDGWSTKNDKARGRGHLFAVKHAKLDGLGKCYRGSRIASWVLVFFRVPEITVRGKIFILVYLSLFARPRCLRGRAPNTFFRLSCTTHPTTTIYHRIPTHMVCHLTITFRYFIQPSVMLVNTWNNALQSSQSPPLLAWCLLCNLPKATPSVRSWAYIQNWP